MKAGFGIKPHEEAAALIAGKDPVSASVFYGLLPELRGRAFTVSGVSAANVLQRTRDIIATLPLGVDESGNPVTWETQKAQLIEELDPYLGDGAEVRAEVLLRTNGFQAFSASTWRVAQEDEDTTHLQYIHGDQAVEPTPEHLALDGIVLPKDDPFWKDHYGPWGHLGCVCYARPMNPDLVAEEKQKDEKRNPENQNVLEGATARLLRSGTILRDGRRYDVSNDGSPEQPEPFKTNPDDLRIPVDALKEKYDEETWMDFVKWAKETEAMRGVSVWEWLH
jgi:hypothetical protein